MRFASFRQTEKPTSTPTNIPPDSAVTDTFSPSGGAAVILGRSVRLISIAAKLRNMVFVKRICPPERRKATIAVRATLSSPTISVRDLAHGGKQGQFQLNVLLSLAESTRPGEAITICTNHSVFHPANPEGDFDTLAQKTVSLTATSDSTRRINLGQFIVGRSRPNTPPPADLKERPLTHFLTIPADGEVMVAHDFSLARMFQHEERLTPTDVIGETWRIRLGNGAIGTTWWCWGSMEEELKDKRFSAWREGLRYSKTARPDGDEWILGRDPIELIFEDRTEDATFSFVE